jgi:dTDP-4-amino-4,6-dideoxygalactose transaminase
MTFIGTIPRRCVNLPPGALRTLLGCIPGNRIQEGPAIEEFSKRFGEWLGVPYVFGTSTGRSAFQLALQALGLETGREIIFPAITFPVMPIVAKMLGYRPVFCDVEPDTLNAGPEHIESKITERTAAVVATHLFGQPCPIQEIAELSRKRGIRVIEDCAHACGARADGRQVGTFGDVGVFSFAEGKNMPCFGGGAVVTADGETARRAEEILSGAPKPAQDAIVKKALSISGKWLLTRPFIFGVTAYQVLRLKVFLGQPLMDSIVGDELLEAFGKPTEGLSPMANLQAAIGLLHLGRIDEFNEGSRRNAQILTENLADLTGIKVPSSTGGDHIYVYYALRVDPEKREDLRRYLLKHGIDSKRSDMSDCSTLRAFRGARNLQEEPRTGAAEDSILELCVYPVISERSVRRLAQVIRSWAGSGRETNTP